MNKLTIFGVMGNLISWRLIGIDTLRFILANTPSVGLTSHWSSFCSASKRSSSDDTRCHWSDGTDSQTRPSAAASQSCNSSSVRIPAGHPLSRPIAEGVVKAYMPAGWPSVVSAKTWVPFHSAARRCKEGWYVLSAAINTRRSSPSASSRSAGAISAAVRHAPLDIAGKPPRSLQLIPDLQ